MRHQTRLCNKCGRAHIEEEWGTKLATYERGDLKLVPALITTRISPMKIVRGNHTNRTRVCAGDV